jgi:D-arabinose 1-dehydrogenase-like Zn-dependent alcohol dehydrogenase
MAKMRAVEVGRAGGPPERVGVPEALKIDPLPPILGRRSVKGRYSGTAIDPQETLAFSALTGVRSMNEVSPLERAAEGCQRMMSGRAQFRVVLTTRG